MQMQTIRLETTQALVMELGRRDVTSSWFMRCVEGKHGLEAFEGPDRMVRLELAETLEDEVA
jgi:hypothetical protein